MAVWSASGHLDGVHLAAAVAEMVEIGNRLLQSDVLYLEIGFIKMRVDKCRVSISVIIGDR